MKDSEKLRSGMLVSEAVARASEWWDKTGRKLIKLKCNEERTRYRVRTSKGKAPGIVTRGPLEKVYSSRLMSGVMWEQLDKREKLEIVKTWHYFYVVQPMIKSGELLPSVEEIEKYGRLGLLELPDEGGENVILH